MAAAAAGIAGAAGAATGGAGAGAGGGISISSAAAARAMAAAAAATGSGGGAGSGTTSSAAAASPAPTPTLGDIGGVPTPLSPSKSSAFLPPSISLLTHPLRTSLSHPSTRPLITPFLMRVPPLKIPFSNIPPPIFPPPIFPASPPNTTPKCSHFSSAGSGECAMMETAQRRMYVCLVWSSSGVVLGEVLVVVVGGVGGVVVVVRERERRRCARSAVRGGGGWRGSGWGILGVEGCCRGWKLVWYATPRARLRGREGGDDIVIDRSIAIAIGGSHTLTLA